MNSDTEKLELGRKLAVPSELVVRRLEVNDDEIDGGGTVPDEVPTSDALLSSVEVSCEDDGADDGTDGSCTLEDD